jgi:hypothetical protein
MKGRGRICCADRKSMGLDDGIEGAALAESPKKKRLSCEEQPLIFW